MFGLGLAQGVRSTEWAAARSPGAASENWPGGGLAKFKVLAGRGEWVGGWVRGILEGLGVESGANGRHAIFSVKLKQNSLGTIR